MHACAECGRAVKVVTWLCCEGCGGASDIQLPPIEWTYLKNHPYGNSGSCYAPAMFMMWRPTDRRLPYVWLDRLDGLWNLKVCRDGGCTGIRSYHRRDDARMAASVLANALRAIEWPEPSLQEESSRVFAPVEDEQPIRAQLVRVLPRTWEGRAIAGTLDTFEEPLDTFEEPLFEEEVRELFGGGQYKLTILSRHSSGAWRYVRSRRFTIAGDPKLDNLITTPELTE